MKQFIFLDTETTGAGEDDYLCQLAYKEGETIFCELYKPPKSIPPEASMVTHITDKMVADKPVFKESAEYPRIKALLENEASILVAHNASFDMGMLVREGITPTQVICTLRLARALDTEGAIPRYNLQYLRYFLGIEIEAAAHDALGDVLVLEQLFNRLYKKVALVAPDPITYMLDVSSKPSLMRRFTFGKYTGKTVKEVAQIDLPYLAWLLSQKRQDPNNEIDWIYTLEQYVVE